MRTQPLTSRVPDKLKRLRAVPFGISDPSSDGWPRGIDHASALAYFNDKYGGPTLPVLVTLLDLSHKRVVSIGSGFGGEEIRIAELGGNEVHCIEPDGPSCEFHAERQKTFPNAKVVLHPMALKQFAQRERESPITTKHSMSSIHRARAIGCAAISGTSCLRHMPASSTTSARPRAWSCSSSMEAVTIGLCWTVPGSCGLLSINLPRELNTVWQDTGRRDGVRHYSLPTQPRPSFPPCQPSYRSPARLRS